MHFITYKYLLFWDAFFENYMNYTMSIFTYNATMKTFPNKNYMKGNERELIDLAITILP